MSQLLGIAVAAKLLTAYSRRLSFRPVAAETVKIHCGLLDGHDHMSLATIARHAAEVTELIAEPEEDV